MWIEIHSRMIEVVKKREEGKLFQAVLFLSRQEKVNNLNCEMEGEV